MKAIVFQHYGQADVLKLTEIEKPIPKHSEVLIKVHAASVNDWDWGLLRGKPFVNRLVFGLLRPKKVKVLGADIAGEIESVGKKVKQFKIGDSVFGDISQGHWGGFAEYVCAHENAITLKPETMTFEEAAATPQAAILALHGLQDRVKIRPGQKVLINGAGGGAGTFAVQIAKSLGAKVTGVDSTEKLGVMLSVGADHVIDYKHEDFTKNGQQYDLILDLMGYHSLVDYKRALSPMGTYTMVGGSSILVFKVIFLAPFLTLFSGKKMGMLMHTPNRGMSALKKLLNTGKIKPVVDKLYPLSKTAEAMRYFGEGHAKGKVVITQEGGL